MSQGLWVLETSIGDIAQVTGSVFKNKPAKMPELREKHTFT